MEVRNGSPPPSIYILHNQVTGKRHRLINGVNIAGRSPPAEVHICLRALISSRKHAEVLVRDDCTVSLHDVGSENGTFINYERIPSHVHAPIIEHDIIGFGMSEMIPNELAPGHEIPVFTLEKLAITSPTTPEESSDSTLSASSMVTPTSLHADLPHENKQNGEDVAEAVEIIVEQTDDDDDDDDDSNNNLSILEHHTVEETAISAGEVIDPASICGVLNQPQPADVDDDNAAVPCLPASNGVPAESPAIERETTVALETPQTAEQSDHTNSNNQQQTQRRQNLIEIDYSRVKIEDCIFEIDDDEDIDTILSQTVFPPSETVSFETYLDIKKELLEFGLDTSSYAPIIDLTEERETELDWLVDIDEFDMENDAVEEAKPDDEQEVVKMDQEFPEGAEETIHEDPAEMMAEPSDSDSDVILKPVGLIKKRRFSRIMSESDPDSDKYDSDTIDQLIVKYLTKENAEPPKRPLVEPSDSSDFEDDDESDESPRKVDQTAAKVMKLKPGSNYVESRMDTKGIQMEMSKRQKQNKRRKSVTNVEVLDKQTRENMLKQRKERLKSLCATNVEATTSKEESAKTKDADTVQKGTAKVKVSDSRGAFLCQQTDSTSARPPVTKYKVPPIVEPHYIPQKVRIAHNRTNGIPTTSANTTVPPRTSNSTNTPSTSTASLNISPSQLRISPFDSSISESLRPPFFLPPRIPSSSTRPYYQHPPAPVHPTINAIIHWNSLDFYEYHVSRSGMIPGLAGGAAASLRHTKTWYQSYEEYRDVVNPLMMMEVWMHAYEDWSTTSKSVKVKIGEVDYYPNYTRIKCRAYVNREFVIKSFFKPHVLLTGDFPLIDKDKKNKIARLIIYIENTNKHPIRRNDIIPAGMIEYGKTADFVIYSTFITKEIAPIDRDRIVSCRFVTSVHNYIRPFDGVDYLQHSPLMKIVLNPTIEEYDVTKYVNYDTPMYNEVKLNESQRRAVLEAAYVGSSPEPLIYLIEGPPGTGKTTVILQIVKQLLFHKQNPGQVRILLLAPSNGAIDNLLLKILQIKKRLVNEKKYPFKMVRIGIEEQMHPNVKQYCIDNYAKLALSQAIGHENPAYKDEYSILTAETRLLKNQSEYNLTNRGTTAAVSRQASSNINNFAEEKLGPDFPRRFAEQKLKIINETHIICSTLNSCYRLTQRGDLPLNHPVTCCIVDEATQSVEQETLIPLMLGVNNLILVGDPQQLPAVTNSPIARSYGYGQSLFTRLKLRLNEQIAAQRRPSRSNYKIQFLDTQYRMNPEISHYPSNAFYNGRLKDAPSVQFYQPPFFSPAPSFITSSPFPNRNYDIAHRPRPVPLRRLRPYLVIQQTEREMYPSQQYGSHSEVELVTGLFREIGLIVGNRDHGIFTVGIITPYNAQKLLIANCIATMNIGIEQGLDVTISTVDGMQGQEKDIIIMSNVRVCGNTFTDNENRINVALTRAKHILYLVASENLFEKSELFKKIEQDAINRNVYVTIPNSCSVREFILQPF